MNSITADLDNIDSFTGTALSDQIWRITDKVNQWMNLAYEEIQPPDASNDGQDDFGAPQNLAWIEEENEVAPPQPQTWDDEEEEEEVPQPSRDWDDEEEEEEVPQPSRDWDEEPETA